MCRSEDVDQVMVLVMDLACVNFFTIWMQPVHCVMVMLVL